MKESRLPIVVIIGDGQLATEYASQLMDSNHHLKCHTLIYARNYERLNGKIEDVIHKTAGDYKHDTPAYISPQKLNSSHTLEKALGLASSKKDDGKYKVVPLATLSEENEQILSATIGSKLLLEKAVKQADAVYFTIGHSEMSFGHDPERLKEQVNVNTNIAIEYSSILQKLPKTSLLMVTPNPDTTIAKVLKTLTGKDNVVTLGGQLDSIRLKEEIAQAMELAPNSVSDVAALGQHGSTFIPLWEHVRIFKESFVEYTQEWLDRFESSVENPMEVFKADILDFARNSARNMVQATREGTKFGPVKAADNVLSAFLGETVTTVVCGCTIPEKLHGIKGEPILSYPVTMGGGSRTIQIEETTLSTEQVLALQDAAKEETLRFEKVSDLVKKTLTVEKYSNKNIGEATRQI